MAIDSATVVEGVNLLNGTGIIGGIVAAATTFGWWMRRERVEAAKSTNAVAENSASTAMHHGQTAEIESLRKRMGELDQAFVSQAALISGLQQQLSILQAEQAGIAIHFNNMILCDVCTANNKRILDKLTQTLDLNDLHSHTTVTTLIPPIVRSVPRPPIGT